jgi:hypothetical protein
MSINQDFKELFTAFNAEGVEYLIVGGYAVIFYAEPRFTKDIDLWVNPSMANAERAYRARSRFGAPLGDVTVEDLTNRDLVYQIGIAPNRIDILMDIGGPPFTEAWQRKTIAAYGDVPIAIIGKNELIQSKKTIGRPQDLLDVDRLQKT